MFFGALALTPVYFLIAYFSKYGLLSPQTIKGYVMFFVLIGIFRYIRVNIYKYVEDWCEEHNLNINASKCLMVIFSIVSLIISISTWPYMSDSYKFSWSTLILRLIF